jgi:hypothetical protein
MTQLGLSGKDKTQQIQHLQWNKQIININQ